VELRTYGKVLWRRLWIIALVVGVVAIYVGYQYYTSHKSSGASVSYQTNVDIRIGLQAPEHSSNQTFTDYIAASETLADEFATGPTLTSSAFGDQVVQQIQTDMPTITARFHNDNLHEDLKNVTDTSAIISALTATRIHSVIIIDVSWSTEAGAWAIAHAVGEVVTAHISNYLSYQVNNTTTNNIYYPVAAARVINNTNTITPVTSLIATRTSLLLALLVVGLILGIALAFLVEYLDDRIHETYEVVQTLQLPIYGEVPRAPTLGHTHTNTNVHSLPAS
jgi:capsular polysaccharide biosynthesis protein